MRHRYELARPARVEVAVFSVLGQQIASLFDAVQPPGHHAVRWPASATATSSPVAPGLYFIRVTIDGQAASHKLLLVR